MADFPCRISARGCVAEARWSVSNTELWYYGHADAFRAPHWQLMGALEALNGMMLFGLTTAFLFSLLSNHWPARAARGNKKR